LSEVRTPSLSIFFQALRSNLIIPLDDKPGLAFLDPMGDTDPTEMINFGTGRIPFKYASLNLDDWDTCFRSWTGYVKGWRDWYLKVSVKNKESLEQYKISQCITLSLSEMSRNESLPIATSYFWSDALNTFLFGHGPMAPTLANVLLLAGLDISSPDVLFSRRNDEPSLQLKTKNIGGWSGYIAEHKKEGTVGHREHVAFLNMWLEKFVFCGKTFGPTTNYHIVAEQLAAGNCIPPRKYLLGVVYHLLRQVSISLSPTLQLVP
jgi:hypothetical protein